MADTPKKNGVRAVYMAEYEDGGYNSNDAVEERIKHCRNIRIVSAKFSRAALYAEKNTKDGETLVGLTKQNDAVV